MIKQMKPRFKIGDEVWLITDNRIIEKFIANIVIYANKIKYGLVFCLPTVTVEVVLNDEIQQYGFVNESDCFATKEELIKSL